MSKSSSFIITILLIFLNACAFTKYVPNNIEGTDESKLVKIDVYSWSSATLVAIDGEEVHTKTGEIIYVLPGEHTLTYDMRYISNNYKDYSTSSETLFIKYTLFGEYELVVSAKAGQTIDLTRQKKRGYEETIEDYISVRVY